MLPFALHSYNLKHLSGSTTSSTQGNVSIFAAEQIVSLNHQASTTLSSPPPATTDWIPSDLYSIQSNETLYGPFFYKHTTLRAVVGIICCLSMLGALLIILSYICVKETRTKARQILVHLSVADFGVACANFIGVTVYFDQYIRACPYDFKDHVQSDMNNTTMTNSVSCHTLHDLCKAQACLAAYSTLASVLWTLSLAVYIYCLVVHSSKKIHLKVVYFSYVFCWGMPLLITIWLIAADYLGYFPQGGSGWCSLKIVDPETERRNIFVVIFGNEFWVYLTFVMVTILYLATHCYIKFKMKDASPTLLQGTNKATVSAADTKFLLIPFSFLLLRIWTTILVVLLIYLKIHPPESISYVLLYAAGIGDSGQGFVNALLFCVFTPKVRKKLVMCVVDSKYNIISQYRLQHHCKENGHTSNLLHSLSTKQAASPSGSSRSNNSSTSDRYMSQLT